MITFKMTTNFSNLNNQVYDKKIILKYNSLNNKKAKIILIFLQIKYFN